MSDRTPSASPTDRPDLRALQLRQEISLFLRNIVDQDTPIDTGGGMGSEDIHCTVDGWDFHIQIHNPTLSSHR